MDNFIIIQIFFFNNSFHLQNWRTNVKRIFHSFSLLPVPMDLKDRVREVGNITKHELTDKIKGHGHFVDP